MTTARRPAAAGAPSRPSDAAAPAPALAVFDLDGTLLPETTSCREIARVVGRHADIHDLEAAYGRGEIDSRAFAVSALRCWSSGGQAVYRRAFEAARFLHGIQDCLAWLRAQGTTTVLVTMSHREFAECFDGFDRIFASDYPHDILDPEDKPLIVERLRAGLGITPDDVIAFGDSMSDLPLFRTLPRTVAVNASPALTELAAYHYRGDDLREALRLVCPTAELAS
ncbi:HAD family hydrolase [Streptomyces angustmyceticus]|uniref:HAD family hydrolase n=1 Tax=Streptomyces angustmyceticus TaxID=285578 RepID=UPI00367C365E